MDIKQFRERRKNYGAFFIWLNDKLKQEITKRKTENIQFAKKENTLHQPLKKSN